MAELGRVIIEQTSGMLETKVQTMEMGEMEIGNVLILGIGGRLKSEGGNRATNLGRYRNRVKVLAMVRFGHR